MQRDNARNVEAGEVQGDLLTGDGVRADADAAVGDGRVLGVRRHASQPLERLLSASEIGVPRCGGGADADPPVHNLRIRVHAVVPGVGEGDRDARVQELVQTRRREAAGGDSDLVLGHHFPVLRSDQFHRRISPR